MAFLIALGTVLLAGCSCVGMGGMLIASIGAMKKFDRLEATCWSFTIGFGVLGWIVFLYGIAGLIKTELFVATMLVTAPGLYCLRSASNGMARTDEPMASGTRIALGAIALCSIALLSVDVLEAIAPPADADTLAYHFALPAQFLRAGQLEFVPRVADGASPLLVQMTYVAVMAIGGEMATTLWVGMVSWMGGVFTFALARPYMGRTWAAAVALIYLSTPAMLYVGGTGQVESKVALFVLAGAAAAAFAAIRRDLSFVVLAGLAAGFFVGAKYTGLLFAAATGLGMFMFWRSLRAATLYAGVCLIAGIQWYLWNWWNTGDPMFPVLYEVLGLPDTAFWTAAQDEILRAVHSSAERPLPITADWFLFYLLHATFAPIDAIESGRTGLGLFAILIAPLALAGAWQGRRKIADHLLTIIAVIVFIFYALWFFSGVSQRVRHLLPVWPLVLVFTTASAVYAARSTALRVPLIACVVAVTAIQLAGQAVFGMPYIHRWLVGEDRDFFLRRAISQYDLVGQTEALMSDQDRVLTEQRQLVYLFRHNVFYYHFANQSQVVARGADENPKRFLSELTVQNVTMLLVQKSQGEPSELALAAEALVAAGCARVVDVLTAIPIGSRSLGIRADKPVSTLLYRLQDETCRL